MAECIFKQACYENTQRQGVTYTSICARTRHVVKASPVQHERMAKFYSEYSISQEFQIGNRRDQTLLIKLRTEKYKGLCAYKSLLDGSYPTCTSVVRSRTIFNTGCRDAQRQRNRDSNFLVRTRKDWSVYTRGVSKLFSVGVHNFFL